MKSESPANFRADWRTRWNEGIICKILEFYNRTDRLKIALPLCSFYEIAQFWQVFPFVIKTFNLYDAWFIFSLFSLEDKIGIFWKNSSSKINTLSDIKINPLTSQHFLNKNIAKTDLFVNEYRFGSKVISTKTNTKFIYSTVT